MNVLEDNFSAIYNPDILPALKGALELTSFQIAITGFVIGSIVKNKKNTSTTIESLKPENQLLFYFSSAFKFVVVLLITIFIISSIGQIIDLHPIIILALIIFFDTHIELKPKLGPLKT